MSYQNNTGKNDWYCHNICNYTKQEEWNNKISSRQFPQYKLPPVFDPRPDFKYCGDKYIVQPTGPITNEKQNIVTTKPNEQFKPTDNKLNLNPLRNDRDCFFCRILNSLQPDKPNFIEYLRRMDIDSYNRGLTQFLTKCPNQKTNPYCLFGGLCPDCSTIVQKDPTIVKIIDRWQDPNACFQLPNTTDLTYKPQYYNGCPGIPIENAFNNRTKRLDNAPVNYHPIRVNLNGFE